MNSHQVRKNYVVPLLSHKVQTINLIFSHILEGGWEGWLQVELGLRFVDLGNATFSREQSYYPNAGARYDLEVTPNRGTSIYFEIKTQRNRNDTTTAARMEADIDKIKGLPSYFKNDYVIIAFAVSKLTNNTELYNLKNLLENPQYGEQIFAYNLNGEIIEPDDLQINKITLFWFANH